MTKVAASIERVKTPMLAYTVRLEVWPRVYKTFSCSTPLSMEFHMLIESKMLKNIRLFLLSDAQICIHHAHKYLNANNCCHFNIYEHDTFHAQLS